MAYDKFCQSRRRMILLPVVAAIVFLSMVGVAEHQIRSSPEWPPPPPHEVGGWHIEDPPIWTLATALNLPASLPILMMSAVSYRFSDALDEHHLILYVPWTFFVFLLWYFVACHLTHFPRRSPTRSFIIFAAQLFITAELIYCGIRMFDRVAVKPPIVVAVCFWAWVVIVVAGWVNMVRSEKVHR
jgi:hypothetical protein